MSIGKIKVQDFLARLPLFNDVDPEELDHIAESTTELHVPRGQQIFRRGDPCVGFHTVVYGQVKLSFVSPGGSEKVVEIIGPGHSFGEALMFMEKPYIVSAHALADSLLLHVAKSAVFDELQRDPKFARKMLAGLSRRLHGLICDVEAYSLRSGAQRVIGYLLKEETPADGDQIRLEVSKNVLASRLNLTPEHFSRILHELANEGLIGVDGRNITIFDIERLRNYGG
ncbi:Crp/Fnr family transcriptional regulator [Noviherbaspirillum autotrophicum]|uniref:Crp/Fnr family transcriptional regulator n=1 Tax=Noviherbaspirillum autotrophicum TaxID=709839 RepID=A0A0C2BJR6_9BURK|nr:Crp/Fnr family transcriptional regulator [Noviherbaspirillum autotrophicum]KIF81435.1 Crp/Fnr family transcriptional regulator [Noviherbaspirillum autotrophicum]